MKTPINVKGNKDKDEGMEMGMKMKIKIKKENKNKSKNRGWARKENCGNKIRWIKMKVKIKE